MKQDLLNLLNNYLEVDLKVQILKIYGKVYQLGITLFHQNN